MIRIMKSGETPASELFARTASGRGSGTTSRQASSPWRTAFTSMDWVIPAVRG